LDEKLVQHRWYRQHCTYIESQDFYVKDLSIFKGIDLSKIILVDNHILSFAL